MKLTEEQKITLLQTINSVCIAVAGVEPNQSSFAKLFSNLEYKATLKERDSEILNLISSAKALGFQITLKEI